MSDTPFSRAELRMALARPFDPGEVRWKPQVVKGNRAQAIAFIDARLVMDRLDDVFGVGGWEDRYDALPGGSVVCTLRARADGDWVTHQDVGSESEQPDGGDRTKAAFSDALKRAAVKFGVGRYLYRLPAQWLNYDPTKRQFTQVPELPEWAYPDGLGKPKTNMGRALESAAVKAGGKPTPEMAEELGRLRDQLGLNEATLARWVRNQLKAELADLTAAQLERVLSGLRGRLATQPAGATS